MPEAHRHDRGPDRVPAPRQALDHQPARGRHGHRLLQARAAPRPAPGPGRDPHRRDARRGDGPAPRSPRPRPATSCFSTLHTVDAPETVNRIIDFFPPHQHQQVRAMLAGTLKGVDLPAPRPDGRRHGRVAFCEVLRMTGRVRDMIIDPSPDGPPARGHRRGRLLRDADLRPGAASSTSRPAASRWTRRCRPPRRRNDFKLLVAADGRRGTTMDDLTDNETRRAAVGV